MRRFARRLALILSVIVGFHLCEPPRSTPAAEPSVQSRQVSSGRKKVKKPSSVRRASRRRTRTSSRYLRLDAALKNETRQAIAEDDLRGEDSEVRRAVLDAIGDYAGTVVVMDPHTGRIYSIVNQRWALRKAFKPCSTIKLPVAVAGLSEGLIDPNALVPLGHRSPALNLTEALAQSNNRYFDVLGAQLGREKIIAYAREWGLGSCTGINLPGEVAGKLPPEKLPASSRRRSSSSSAAAVGLMASHGDGFEVTALQLAVLTSALANGGYLYQPQVVRSEAEARNFRPLLIRQLNLSEEHRRSIIAGMVGAVQYGTAKSAYDPAIPIAGKTGSCRNDTLWTGLFVSFAPVHRPQLVVVVITEGLGQRGPLAAQIAGRIYQRLAHRLADRPVAESPASAATAVASSSSARLSLQALSWIISLLIRLRGPLRLFG